MTKYYCENCDNIFDEPFVVPNKDQFEVGWSPIAYCPICSYEGHFEETSDCPKCGDPMKPHEILCTNCQTALRWKFRHFVDFLTADEEEQLDEWLDGRSVTEI